MDGTWLILAFLGGAAVGVYCAVRECANAVLHGKHKWWKVAIFNAQHRVALREFRRELDEVNELERNLAAKTMSCDRDTHRNDNPQWIEEEK
jgi:hypothetical protein